MFNLTNLQFPGKGPDLVYIYGPPSVGKSALLADVKGERIGVYNPDQTVSNRLKAAGVSFDVITAEDGRALFNVLEQACEIYDTLIVDDLMAVRVISGSMGDRKKEYALLSERLPRLRSILMERGRARIYVVDTIIDKQTWLKLVHSPFYRLALPNFDYIAQMRRTEQEGSYYSYVEFERARTFPAGYTAKLLLRADGRFDPAYSTLEYELRAGLVTHSGTWYIFPDRPVQGLEEALQHVRERSSPQHDGANDPDRCGVR